MDSDELFARLRSVTPPRMRAVFVDTELDAEHRLVVTCDGGRRRIEEDGALSLVSDGATVVLRDPGTGCIVRESANQVHRYGLLEALLSPSRIELVDQAGSGWNTAYSPRRITVDGRPAWQILMLPVIVNRIPMELVVDETTGVVIRLSGGGRTVELRNLTELADLPDSTWRWPDDDPASRKVIESLTPRSG